MSKPQMRRTINRIVPTIILSVLWKETARRRERMI